MAISYTTLGSTVTITDTGIIPASQLNTDVAIVGGYDEADSAADVNAGEVTEVTSSTEAESQFGATSELARQARLAFRNGAGTVHGIPVPETQTTESFGTSTATSSGTLSNGAVLDPRTNPDEQITAQDVTGSTSVTVNLVDGTPSTPANSNTINLNPVTREWEADASSEYEITYTYGDYDTAIGAAAGEEVRALAVCSENDTVKADLRTDLEDAEKNFRFLRGIVGSMTDIQPLDIGDYQPAEEDWRIVEVAPARGQDEDGEVSTVGAIAGLVAGQPVDVSGSITFNTVSGLESLDIEYTPLQAEDFEQVTAITDEFEVAEGVTTSAETGFRDIYKVEIIDLVVENLYARIKDFRGGSNSQGSRRLFASRLKRLLGSYSAPDAQPPLLATADGTQPYYVSQDTGATDTETDIQVGIEVAPIAKTVNLDLSVGPIEFGGATLS